MSYDEHLISQAGGDGEPLEAVQRRSDVAMDYPGMVTIEQSQADVPYLLALVREQAAKLEAVRELADEWEMNAGPGSRSAEVFGPQKVSVEFAVLSIRAALEPTP